MSDMDEVGVTGINLFFEQLYGNSGTSNPPILQTMSRISTARAAQNRPPPGRKKVWSLPRLSTTMDARLCCALVFHGDGGGFLIVSILLRPLRTASTLVLDRVVRDIVNSALARENLSPLFPQEESFLVSLVNEYNQNERDEQATLDMLRVCLAVIFERRRAPTFWEMIVPRENSGESNSL
ncbi:hypothetical protein BSKO_02572 [Bryopsis sp. KO-2023]|nr:hypothetical protein BSKO_02572 [Bryopsis sp. KO-2023]